MIYGPGIRRRIDELGRIVIPKEIRRFMHIAEGDEMEILTDSAGYIILRRVRTNAAADLEDLKETIFTELCQGDASSLEYREAEEHFNKLVGILRKSHRK